MTYNIILHKRFLIAPFLCCYLIFANESACGGEEISSEIPDLQALSLQSSSDRYQQLFFPLAVSSGQTEGRYLGNSQGFTSLSLFASRPILKFGNPFLPFLDLQVHRLNGGKIASNLGGGFRIFNDNTQAVIGGNVFYDTYEGDYRYYHQLGIGGEFLGPYFDFRINGYMDLGKSTGYSRKCIYDDYVGGYFASSQKHQASMRGVEFQLGKWITRNAFGFFNLYTSIGPYFYISSKHSRHRVYGGQGCFLAYFTPYISCELKGGYDPVFHSSIQGSIKVTIPFSWQTPNFNGFDIIYQPVRRQKLIVLDHKSCCWTWNWDDNL